MCYDEPIMLSGERVWRTYIGGRNIGRLHGDADADDSHFPEEWMYSVTRAFNTGREKIVEGLCRLADHPDRTLKQLVENSPEEMLGKEHVKKWGNTPGVLIKLIDCKERLTIQVHPDKERAQSLFDSRFGKTECWHILDTRTDGEGIPCIYLGFRTGITRKQWEECFREQDCEKMLSMLNRLEVKRGETYLVKGGVPHAIGAGCLMIEVQEPTDYTIRVEKTTPSGFNINDEMCHQGLGYEKMFECFSYEGETLSGIRKKYGITPKIWEKGVNKCCELVGYKNTECFRIEKIWIEGDYKCKGEEVFYCIYIMSGQGIMKTMKNMYEVKRNTQFFVPACSLEYYIIKTGKEPVQMLKIYGPE